MVEFAVYVHYFTLSLSLFSQTKTHARIEKQRADFINKSKRNTHLKKKKKTKQQVEISLKRRFNKKEVSNTIAGQTDFLTVLISFFVVEARPGPARFDGKPRNTHIWEMCIFSRGKLQNGKFKADIILKKKKLAF